MSRSVFAARCGCAILIAAVPNVGASQVIVPRTVPVLIGQQFDILPSHRAGMASVSIALDDTLIDPFVNPAKASRLRHALLARECRADRCAHLGAEPSPPREAALAGARELGIKGTGPLRGERVHGAQIVLCVAAGYRHDRDPRDRDDALGGIRARRHDPRGRGGKRRLEQR